VRSFHRAAAVERLGRDRFDVLVVGGGITGCGVALDAAARGLSVALVEKDDLASGTSSRSSKLVHGGLRYLQQKEFALVYENLQERQRLLRNAPHLVRILPFLIPVFGRAGVANKAYARTIGTALWLYDLTGGWRVGKVHRRISRADALGHLPTLRTDALVDAFLYYDAQTDDARLTLAVARTAAVDHGACVVNHARVVELTRDAEGRADGALLAGDGCDGLRVRARCVVGATGVWADDLRAMDPGSGGSARTIRPAKGIHLTVPSSALPCDVAAVVTAEDKRSIFIVPWQTDDGALPLTYLGTTDTDYEGPIDDPQCTPEDVAYVLDTVNRWVSRPLTPGDVVGTWAGLRPLLVGTDLAEKTKDLSRRHRVTTSASGVVTIGGGKLTTYRKMAEDTVDVVVDRLGISRRCPTRRLPLRGAPGLDQAGRERLQLAPDVAAHLAGRYGTEARVVAAMVAADPALGRPIVPGLPDLRAEVVHAARHEMACTLDDVLARRTRLRLQARDASAAAADDVAALLAPELGWDGAETDRQSAAYRASVEHERAAPGLPATPRPGAGTPVGPLGPLT